MSNLDLRNAFWQECHKSNKFASYKHSIQRARPYTLDDDATELVTKLASGKSIFDKIATYRFLARLPFDEIWIEIPYEPRWRIKRELAVANTPEVIPEDAPKRMGWLLKKIDTTTWSAITVVQFVNDRGELEVSSFGIKQILNTNGPVTYQSELSDPKLRAIVYAINEHQIIPAMMWGFSASEDDKAADVFGNLRLPTHLNRSVAIDLDKSWEHAWLTMLNEDAKSKSFENRTKSLSNYVLQLAREVMGDMRYLTAALAVLNELPFVEKTVRPEGKIRIAGAIKTYMVNRVVTINIPKSRNSVTKALKLLRLAEVRMRRHEVCGHWKRVRIKGGTELRWVEPYARGDASLGYVRQVREVVSH